ncbi:energy transducer TonB [Dyella sedimenti]|uniref:energy transducer TonB n=1 Tax=Dyella sedimenti TaxID=2919947 RepID=UPI001FAB274C|nr:energy transducer TonB [Dyella sedimenti]
MDTRYISHARRRARGAVRPAAIAIVVVVAVLAAASWFLIIKPHQELMEADAGGHPSTPVQPGAQATPPANVAAMSLNQLLAEARKAVNDQRLLAPSGNNAFEFYLKVLEKQPGNQVASDALRETFPVGASVAEQTINQRDFNEAQRQIDLLAKADPANYTLTILRSKLDAQRKLQDREQQQEADKERQAQLAAQKAAADKADAERQAAEAQQRALADQRAAQARQAQQQAAEALRQQQSAPANAAASAVAASSGSATHGPVLVRNVNPRYPTAAVRSNQEGWVEVSFTITPEGNVDDVKVIDAEPRHVFDRAAVEAVSRWKYDPATKDGTPVATQDKRRIVFKLN